jgi:hypothetical protein
MCMQPDRGDQPHVIPISVSFGFPALQRLPVVPPAVLSVVAIGRLPYQTHSTTGTHQALLGFSTSNHATVSRQETRSDGEAFLDDLGLKPSEWDMARRMLDT